MEIASRDSRYQHESLRQKGVDESSVPSAPELKIAKLCANCSGAMLQDDRDGFGQRIVDNELPRLLFPVKSYHSTYRSIWEDTMPSLPQIEKSSLQGCDFCSFLRTSILSRDTNDVLVKAVGVGLADLDTRNVSISVAYCWSNGSPDRYRDIHNGRPIRKNTFSNQGIFSYRDNTDEQLPSDFDKDILNHEENIDDETIAWGSPSAEDHHSINAQTDAKADDGQLEGLIIRLIVETTDKYIPPMYFCCYVTQAPRGDDVGNWLGLALPSSQNYSEPHRLDWMRQTLRKCEAHNHQPIAANFAPERLIDVSPPNPKLVLRGEYHISQTNSYVPTYAVLSYCWGPPDDAKSQLTTTNETFEKRRQGIECHEMTQVLKDAIFMTRELGIPYLWIDALCIKQGDMDDWERQSVDMSKIYGNAKVTLCAASSMSCQESFLRQRGARVRIPFHSILRPTITGSFDVQFKYVLRASNGPKIFTRRGMDAFDFDLMAANWAGRGWVFQERVSSRSKILFGNSFIHFICDNGSERMSKSFIDSPCFKSLSTILNEDTNGLYHAWRSIVLQRYARFNSSSFTNHTDLLPALSGLAQCFHQWLQDDFLAGFWRKDLLRSLLWFVRYYVDGGFPPHESEFLPSSNSYAVPSWSILGRGYSQGSWKYDWRLKNVRPATQLLYATTDLESGNPFGAITGGRLTIRGKILDFAHLDKNAISIINEGCIESYYPYELRYNIEAIGRFILDFRYTKLIHDKSCYGKNEGEAILKNIESLKWILLGRVWEQGLGEGAFGLILRQVPNLKGVYHRVGVFSPPWGLSIPYGLSMFKKLGKTRTVVII
ncbi:heterokaryon incompatibility protein-domain-containing protein [Annulohypoxylon stygium]|nr:heterokaryon incompatibility protein-domain-containing protein [Annulohypoxylon stygium]